MTARTRTTVVLPIRSFQEGKSRLGRVLAPQQRRLLAQRWAERVLRAAGYLPVTVLTRDAEVARWALANGADTIADRGWDLNSSLSTAAKTLQDHGIDRVVIAHGDLPLADDLTWLESHRGVVIIPDRRSDGSNVLATPTDTRFRFRYGPSSSRRHQDEALRLGLPVTVVSDPLLGWDVDLPEDLRIPEGAKLADLGARSRRARDEAATRARAHREPRPAGATTPPI